MHTTESALCMWNIILYVIKKLALKLMIPFIICIIKHLYVGPLASVWE